MWSSELKSDMLCFQRCSSASSSHTLVVTSDYLNYCRLTLSSGYSWTFSAATHWMFLSFLDYSLQTTEMVVWDNPSTSAVSEILRPTAMPHSKSVKQLFPKSGLSLDFSRSSQPCLHELLPCDWLI